MNDTRPSPSKCAGKGAEMGDVSERARDGYILGGTTIEEEAWNEAGGGASTWGGAVNDLHMGVHEQL